ncbi:MAG TPA: sulfite dehydrogenase [Polyangiaceae bacterium]|nr:sulfite dehydrogenase [Polyangiaceae bacterium]
MEDPHGRAGRRAVLALGAATLGLAACRPEKKPPPPAPSRLGTGCRAYGERSRFETAARSFRAASATPGTAASGTPLQDLHGILTPSGLHFERHHAGVPTIDPAKHELLLHGLVARPLVFTLADLRRLPSVSRIHFLECASNSGREHEGRPGETPQKSHGLASCSEWMGVPLRVLLEEAGMADGASWIVAEGADACRHARSVPLDKAFDDALVAYGQNGEALRPEQDYPLRLVVPGWEGNVNVKWLNRLHVIDQPAMTKDEAASYTDLMPDGKARQFSFVMEAKSVIMHPAGGQRLAGPGFQEITGLAWSGRGRIARVDVSVDGGRTWAPAELEEPVLLKAFTRFRLPWSWGGGEAALQSRAVDETGYVQPVRDELVKVRGMRPGPDGFNHYNGIKTWYVRADGSVTHA